MKNKTINKQIEELNQIIKWFDSDDFELEEAIVKINEATELAEQIEQKLEKIKNEVTIVKNKFDSKS